MSSEHKNKVSLGMILVTIGIVYGDIGTSPMYVMKSILEGNGGLAYVDENFIIGALSLTIWTITLLTTIKHVLIALQADNHGEGGIFALYALVRKCGKWLIIPTMIGGCTMLADGVLTPAVTVTTAVEGLRSIPVMDKLLGSGQTIVIIVTIAIISTLFFIQKSGTSRIGKIFGPVMLLWFGFLGITGVVIGMGAGDLTILKAFNPMYAIWVLVSPGNKAGFMILGSVFLCTTGAEALYTDMGHVGKENIYISWPFVKICLILNYMGQCVWILNNRTNAALLDIEEINPFYMMLPEMMRPFAVVLSALAAIIASQALISGSYTLVREAAGIDLMPKLRVQYPSDTKGQLYIPVVNNFLWIGCILVVLYFKSGARMENAYGLAITISMLMMTILFTVYIGVVKNHKFMATLFMIVFGAIEMVFFISSLGKFTKGGYVAVIVSVLLLFIMVIWYRGSAIEQMQKTELPIENYIDKIKNLMNDERLEIRTNNMVYLSKSKDAKMVDRDLLYSILDKNPKKAEAYWFVTVVTTEEPYTKSYSVETFGTDFIFSVRIYLGYKRNQMINIYLRQIVADLFKSGELPPQHRRHSIYDISPIGNFKFCIVKKMPPLENELSHMDAYLVRMKYSIRKLIGGEKNWFGLETSNLIEEYVPMFLPKQTTDVVLERID